MGSVTIPLSDQLAKCVLLLSTILASAYEPPGSQRRRSFYQRTWCGPAAMTKLVLWPLPSSRLVAKERITVKVGVVTLIVIKI